MLKAEFVTIHNEILVVMYICKKKGRPASVLALLSYEAITVTLRSVLVGTSQPTVYKLGQKNLCFL